MNSKPKLLIISDYYLPHWTGIARSIFNLSTYLESQFDLTILTIQHDKNLPLTQSSGQSKILRSPYLFSLSRAKISPQLIFLASKIINSTDIVLINSPCSNILPLAFLAHRHHKRLIIFHQGDLVLPKSFVNQSIQKTYDLATYMSCQYADIVSTYSQDYANHSRTLRPFLNKCKPALLPIYPPKTSPKPITHPQLSQLKNRGFTLCGFAGRFVEEKGFDILLEAIPAIVAQKPKIKFIFAGDTNISYEKFFHKNQSLIQANSKHLIFLGLLDPNHLSGFYSQLDLLITPSRSDCFNLVQAEAMLHKVPVLVSDIPGARFLVNQTGFGLTFQTENPRNLAHQCLTLIDNIDLYKGKSNLVRDILNDQANARIFAELIAG